MKLIVLSLIIISSQAYTMVMVTPNDLGLDVNCEREDSPQLFNLHDLDDQESPKSDSDFSYIDVFEDQTPRDMVMFIYNIFHTAEVEGKSLTVEQVVADLKKKYVGNIDREDAEGFCALAYAYANKFYDVMRVLLALDINANWQSRDGVPLLHSAICDNDQEAFSILIEHDADMMLPGHNRATAFHITAQAGHELCYPGENLSLGKNPNTIVDMYGATPLHYAAWYGQPPMALRLIDEDAGVNVCDNNDSTPLHYAARNLKNGVEVAKILVRNHVNVMARNKDDTDDGKGHTALEVAKFCKNKKMVKYLETLVPK